MRPIISVCLLTLTSWQAWGQQYELVDPNGLVSANIEVAAGRLLVYERTGQRVYFSREARYDSPDGRYVGYYDYKRNRVLRFPRSGSGALQTADLSLAAPRFQRTLSTVRRYGAVGNFANNVTLNNNPIGAVPNAVDPWQQQVPATPGPTFGGAVTTTNPYATGYRAPLAQSIRIDSQIVAGTPLSPARVIFQNDGPRQVQLTINDALRGTTRAMSIRPGAAVEAEFERDATATRVDHYRVITPTGETATQERSSPVQPGIRYEVVVREMHVQSIAIDRTGKSPQPIEDIKFEGRGIGRFTLPPGPELQSGIIEVVRAAAAQGNEWSIRPIPPSDDYPGGPTPLERVILETQQAAQGRSR